GRSRCTSRNPVHRARTCPEDQAMLFLPDPCLGEWVRRATGRDNIHLWLGERHVHAGIMAEYVERAREAHPDAELLVHPECACGSRCLLDLQAGRLGSRRTHVLSTEGMVRHAAASDAGAFLAATEPGAPHRLRR